MDKRGKEIKSGRVENLQREVEEFLNEVEGKMVAPIEASRSSYTMVDLMKGIGVKVNVAHPKELRAIATAKIKTDKRSSETLAHLLRADLIPEVFQRSEENHQAHRVLRQRVFFVRSLTRVKIRLRALIAQLGKEVQPEMSQVKNIFSRTGQRLLTELPLAEPDQALLRSLLNNYKHLEARISESDRRVHRLYLEMRPARLISVIGHAKMAYHQ